MWRLGSVHMPLGEIPRSIDSGDGQCKTPGGTEGARLPGVRLVRLAGPPASGLRRAPSVISVGARSLSLAIALPTGGLAYRK